MLATLGHVTAVILSEHWGSVVDRDNLMKHRPQHPRTVGLDAEPRSVTA